ncbi:MAG: dihydroorotate dehydrogenase-like protein [Chromatiales bacterium]|jgi:dihydroorotate dehydrogenase (fumarate)
MDLSTEYLGMKLRHPIVVGASPLSNDMDTLVRLEDAGAAAVVMGSLYEEQIKHEEDAVDYLMSHGAERFAESLSYFPDTDAAPRTAERYLERLQRASTAMDIPVIGSLNGITDEGWTDYARSMEQAGAAALELNVYLLPADPQSTSDEVEQRYLDILGKVRSTVSIPIAMKLSPFFSATGHMAQRLLAGGANGLVLFNRLYQPDLDPDTMEVTPSLKLSSPEEMRLPLLWIGILYGRLSGSLAASTGVDSEREVVKYLMAGADAVQTTSALLRQGADHLATLRDGLARWMEQHGYESVGQMKGAMSQQNVADPEAYERANYLQTLWSYRAPHAA